MEKTSLNIRHLCLIMAASLLVLSTSCTKDPSEDSLYEQEAKKKKNTTLKPRIDRMDVQPEPDNG